MFGMVWKVGFMVQFLIVFSLVGEWFGFCSMQWQIRLDGEDSGDIDGVILLGRFRLFRWLNMVWCVMWLLVLLVKVMFIIDRLYSEIECVIVVCGMLVMLCFIGMVIKCFIFLVVWLGYWVISFMLGGERLGYVFIGSC